MAQARNLRFHLAVLALSAAVPLAALVLFDLARQTREDGEQALEDAQRMARSVALRAELRLKRAELLLAALSQRDDLRELDATLCPPVFGLFNSLFVEYTNLTTVRRDGVRVCSAIPIPPDTPLKVDQALFLQETLTKGGFTLGRVTRGTFTKRWVLFAAQPLAPDAQGQSPGVVAVALDLAALKPVDDVGTLPLGMLAQLVDGRGLILASSDEAEDRIGTQLPTDTPWLLRPAAQVPTTARLRDAAGAERYYAFAPVAGTPWQAAVSLPVDLVLAPSRERASVRIGAVVLALLATLAIAALVLRRTARPVEALAALTRKASSEPVRPPDIVDLPELSAAPREVQDLGRDLQAMLQAWASAAHSLRELHERFAKVFHTSPLGIAITRADDARFVDMNPAFEALVGWSRDEAIGKTSMELGFWADNPDRAMVLGKLREGSAVSNVESRFRKRTGEVVDAAYAGCVVEIGGVSHIVSMASDITPQKKARRALEQHQERLEALVAQRTADLAAANADLERRNQIVADLYDHAPCGYFSLDPQRRVTQANETLLKLLGRRREEFIGHVISDFMTPDSVELQKLRWPELLSKGRVRDLEYDFVRKDGSLLPALISGDMARDADGHFVETRATLVDNSERKLRERQIELMQHQLAERAEQADAANRAKSAFLANMSHEIRTPMNAIIGLTHLMTRDIRDAMQRERLAKIDGAARHLLQVINDILDLSKIEAGRMNLELIDFSLDVLLSRCFEMVSETAREKGLELVLDTDHLPAHLRGDPTRLSQALINLLSNAVKFTDKGWVRLRGELLAEDRRRLRVRFEVQDSGPGIEQDRLSDLFTPFEQADSSTTRRHGGTGLGLALTRHLAQMMGGEVGATSQPGEGSRFWFTAWLERASEAGESAAPIPLQGLHALLVDDLPEALSALGDALQALGLQVDSVGSGQAALRLAQDRMAAGRPYDLLLIDWRMSPLDGIETLRRLRMLLGAGTPPAVLVTAFNEDSMWRQSRDARFDAVLVKPITPSALHDTLVRMLRPQAATLPLVQMPPGTAELSLREHHAGQRVLLAEDNAINREVAEELLRGAGLLVETAEDGERAVTLALARPYDIILMDMQMPRLDGLSAARAIRREAGPGTPIVAMTANAFGEDRQACLDAGMNDHVPKPVDPQRLYETLLRWLPLPPNGQAGGKNGQALSEGQPGLPPQTLAQRLAGVPDLDVAQGLRFVGNHPLVLERTLRSFANAYAQGEAALSAESAPDLKRWQAACHSLVGVSATVGATALHAEIKAFVAALVTADDLASLAPKAHALHEQLRDLARAIGRSLDA